MKKQILVEPNGYFKQDGRYIFWHSNTQVAGCVSLLVADLPTIPSAKKLCRELNEKVQAKIPEVDHLESEAEVQKAWDKLIGLENA
ncbi:MAG: hypothetical protein WA919_02320 [Coleofasciculaceae cyanobacterium]